MNIWSPLDESRERAFSPEAGARLVAVDAPCIVVDLDGGVVLAANQAATDAIAVIAGKSALNPSMPALAVLRSHIDHDGATAMLWWTPQGPVPMTGTIERIPAGGRSIARVTFIAPAASSAPGTIVAGASPSAAPSNTRDDLATLREIGRRIRSAISGGTSMADPQSAATAAGPSTASRPPPLDFKPLKQSGVESREYAEVNEPRDELTRKLAHELRTPLSAIVSLAEIMRDERLGAMGNARYRVYAADIHDTARHTLDLITALLDGNDEVATNHVAKPVPVDLKALDLAEIASRCVSAMQPIAARGGVALVVEPGQPVGDLLADRRAIRQIILNLLSNALRFTPNGGRISLALEPRADGGVALSVKDTGDGMNPTELDRARGGTAAQPRLRIADARGGNGFGLSIVRELAHGHGATVEIESQPLQGTTVSVLFPATSVVRP